jgi:hypothetical protein
MKREQTSGEDGKPDVRLIAGFSQARLFFRGGPQIMLGSWQLMPVSTIENKCSIYSK